MLPIASTSLVKHESVSNAIAQVTLQRIVDQKAKIQKTTPTMGTPGTTIKRQETKSTPHVPHARKQTILRTDVSIRKFTNKLKLRWQQKLNRRTHKHGEPALISPVD